MAKAKIVRYRGYLVRSPWSDDDKLAIDAYLSGNGVFQQAYLEESEEFELNGEMEENCDLALLARHFKENTELPFNCRLPQKGEKYRHFKTGKIVDIIGISRHTETKELTVVYEHDGEMWNRPVSMFLSPVDKAKYPDAVQKMRFEKVEQ